MSAHFCTLVYDGRMFTRIGLTGGIGAGKSTLAHHFEKNGALVLDYDALSREVTAPGTETLFRIVDAFGPQARGLDGHLDRSWIAKEIFADPRKRSVLNDIIHPAVFRRAGALETAWLETPHEYFPGWQVAVHDIPLLVESGRADFFDVVLAVEAPARTRLHRLVEERGMTMEAAAARIDAQASDEDRRAIATYTIDATQPVEQMFDYADSILTNLYTEMRGESTH